MTDFVVVIPARFASERLPGKPLRDIAGKPMLQHVWQRGIDSGASEVIVATDDKRIADVATGFGATVSMTAATHLSGTDRIAEVADRHEWPDERVVVNLQGDEPLMPSGLISQCAALLDDPAADLATLASPISSRSDFLDPNVVKVLTDNSGFALYFSRAAIPYSRDADSESLAMESALHHHGLYAYRAAVLRRLVAAEASTFERCEKLEQLRAMSLGLTIRVGVPAERPGPGVDTERDLRTVAAILARQH